MQHVIDRLEIQELLARYARAVDSKDWELLRTVFTPDAEIDLPTSGTKPTGSRDDLVAWWATSLDNVPMTQHLITNVEIDLDGDRATVRALFFNPMRLPGAAELSYCGGHYYHEVVRTAEGWKSAKMVDTIVWFANRPASPAATR
ncbi:nuclear transport factor 2 family protein [Nocardia sp. alder85J]|uniref:nuclear transport factor 2 family protein n=1 Tax=Nocardia sp. alder85J TaxID=2862949 RepID=UPI001CD701FD|nr:nuclear transport factor 2 family protein [Nocardia sp. alder85J]MCX4095909.1 nuclear transport factor 2 family protein [Nocardia sp. alder85J]